MKKGKGPCPQKSEAKGFCHDGCGDKVQRSGEELSNALNVERTGRVKGRKDEGY